MGLTDMFNSVTEKVRRHSPDVATHVSNGCRSSYVVGCAAVSKIDNVVRVKGSEKLKDYIPDSEARQKIFVHALNLVDSPLGKEALKLIPGAGLAYETYKWSQSVEDDNKTKGKQAGNHKVEADHADLKYEKEVLHGNAGRSSRGSTKALHPASVMPEKPEDVLRDFMQNGFMGRAFMDTLFVPNVGTIKNHQKEG